MNVTPSHLTTRRSLLKVAGIATTAGLLGAVPFAGSARAAALTKAERDKLTPDEIIAMMKRGNERFRSGKGTQHSSATSRACSPGSSRR